MKRNAALTLQRPDPLREAVGLPAGVEGEYFVGATGFMGQESSTAQDVVNHNVPPSRQPGLWCQWTVSNDNQRIIWDGGEKFYNYVEWLQYIVTHFLKTWGRELNGEVLWQGEEMGDRGLIRVSDNIITTENLR
jgi:hypothetical protein